MYVCMDEKRCLLRQQYAVQICVLWGACDRGFESEGVEAGGRLRRGGQSVAGSARHRHIRCPISEGMAVLTW
jgi:hypothetical protein